MSEKPLVSVLMTAYNREKYIKQAIESVLASSYTNFELIVVDDQSSDNTYNIAQQYAAKDNRVRVYRNAVNLGDYPNRNQAASYAKGKYLKYVDADDLIYWHGLEVMVRSMEQYPDAALGLCCPQSDFVIYPIQLQPREAFREHFFEADIFGRSPLGAIIRTDIFRTHGGFSGKRFIGDTELWFALAARYPMVKMLPGLAHWRNHGNQELFAERKNPNIINVRLQFILEQLTLAQCPLQNSESIAVARFIKFRHARYIWRLLLRQPFIAWQVFKGAPIGIGTMLRALLPMKPKS